MAKNSPGRGGSFQLFHWFLFLSGMCNGLWIERQRSQLGTIQTGDRGSDRVLFNDVSLVEKYQLFLDMLIWDEEPLAGTVFFQAKGDALNPGVLDKNGKHISCKPHVYVDDVLIA